MVIYLPFFKTKVKPIIRCNIFHAGKFETVFALIDTGASKVCWVGDPDTLLSITTDLISAEGTASGFGKGIQTDLNVYKANLGLRYNSDFITYRDVQITVANLATNNLYDIVLPNALFNSFSVLFDWGCKEGLGALRLDTCSNNHSYTVNIADAGTAQVLM